MGKLIVVEGIDGSGKSTQFNRLCEHLADDGIEFMRLVFPRYNEESSALVRMYLRGEFGTDPRAVNSYVASCFFAVDRAASYLKDWKPYYQAGGLILTDRYTTSNAIHQASKLSAEDRERFFQWLYDFEFNLMELPKPDGVIYLDITAEEAAANMKVRQEQSGTSGDIHEKDLIYLDECSHCGRHAAKFLNWNTVSCFADGKMRSIEDIHTEIYNLFLHLYNAI